MKIKIISLLVLSLLITGCAGVSRISRTVTLIGNDRDHYIGQRICESHTGDPVYCMLSIEVGPNGEKFTGPYVEVDRTAYSQTRGE